MTGYPNTQLRYVCYLKYWARLLGTGQNTLLCGGKRGPRGTEGLKDEYAYYRLWLLLLPSPGSRGVLVQGKKKVDN